MIEQHAEIDRELVREILDLVDGGRLDELSARLKGLHAADVAHLLESLPAPDRRVVFDRIDPDRHGEILAEVSEEVQPSLVREMDQEELVQAVEAMDVDDAADLVGDLPEEVAKDVLDAMDEQDRRRIEHAMSYAEDTAGGLMEPVPLTLRPDITVGQVLRYARRRGLPKRTDKLFVVDRDGILRGSLRLSVLVSAREDEKVEAIMGRKPRTIHVDTPEEEVALIFERYDLVSAAVVDDAGRLLGRITVDDVVDIIRDQGEQQILNMAGVSEDEELFGSVFRTSRARSTWLVFNLVAAFFAAWVIGLFQARIQHLVALAVLLPVVASLAGNVGNQALTVVIRGLATGQISRGNRLDLFRKEILVGLTNGLFFAALVGAAVALWFDRPLLGAVIASAILLNLLTAAGLGSVIPLLLKRFGVDPPLAGSVLLTATMDVLGYFVFLGLASLVLF